MTETVLRYSLPNGTHVLIHQSALGGKEVANLPLIVVEDGTSSEAAQSAECSSEKNSNQVVEEINNENGYEEQKNFEVLGLGELAEVVTCYKCKKCTFSAFKLSDLLQHLKNHNLEKKICSTLNRSSESSKTETVLNQSNVPVIVNVCSVNNSEVSNSINVEDVKSDTCEQLVFLCGQCTQGFNSLDACKEHMVQDHELIVQEEEEEEEAVVDSPVNTEGEFPKNSRFQEKEFLKSIKETRPICKFLCSKQGCRLKFSDNPSLSVHEGCHITDGSVNQFRCKECGIAFGHWRGCAIHLWTEHKIDTGLLLCPICEKYRTAVITRMVAHMQTHSDARSFCCHECGKGFKQASQLYNHRVIHMDRKADQLPRWYSTKRCDICFKTYADSKCLKKHIQAVHSKLKPYVCQVCGHASARRAMLQMHLRQHTGEKPHACTTCSYRTGDHNSLRRHMMRHTGQRPYRCPHCPYTAIQSSPYKNHLRSKHPGQEGIFCCIHCSFRTVNQENYVLHVSDHKNGLIPSETSMDKVELNEDGYTLEALDISGTSVDRTIETITIKIPSEDPEDSGETSNSLLEVHQSDGDNIDTGGITIPANTEPNLDID